MAQEADINKTINVLKTFVSEAKDFWFSFDGESSPILITWTFADDKKYLYSLRE